MVCPKCGKPEYEHTTASGCPPGSSIVQTCGCPDCAALRAEAERLRGRAEAAENDAANHEAERNDLFDRLHEIIGLANGDDGPEMSEWSLDDPREAVQELRAEVERLEGENARHQDRAENFRRAWNELAQRVYETAQEKGFRDDPPSEERMLLLMHAEISEACEWLRRPFDKQRSDHLPSYTGVEEELADVVIRIMDMGVAERLEVASAILAKMEFNAGRPHKHGGKAF